MPSSTSRRVTRDRPRRNRAAAPSGRSAAAQALARILQFDAPADRLLRQFFRDCPQLGRRERAAIAESVFDVLRHRRLYAHHAQSGSGPIEQRLLDLSARRAELSTDGLPAAIRLSLPDWLHERLVAQYEPDDLAPLAQSLLASAPLDLRANLLHADRAAVMDALTAGGITCHVHPLAPAAIRVDGKPALDTLAAWRDGWFEVQDAGSQAIAHLVAPRRGQRVVDFCAGAGGKTLAMAALMRGTGQVYACDPSPVRLARMRPRLARSGATNVQPFAIDHEGDPRLERLAGRADAVLVDAPCSGTGTLRRNPDLKWRMTAHDVAELVVKQQSILAAASKLVRPGGVLVYATCSLLAEENDEVAAAFESRQQAEGGEWSREPAGSVLAAQGLAIDASAPVLRLRPDRDDTDAFFAVRWRRADRT